MAEYTIDKISYGNNIYNLQDNTSTNTDEKVKTTPTTSDVDGYLTFSSSAAESINSLNKHSSIQITLSADNVVNGQTELTLGNTVVEGDSGAKIGVLELYGSNQYMVRLTPDTLTSTRLVKLPNKAGTIALTSDIVDKSLELSEAGSNITYYPVVGTGTSATTREYDTTGLEYKNLIGSSATVGNATLTLGNSIASGTFNNKQGRLVMYGSTAYAHTIQGAPTAARTLTLPDKTGTVALTSDIPTVPTITLNGSSTTSPSFYAPTSAGTSDYVLKSNGSGAPTWTSAVLTDEKLAISEAESGSYYPIFGTGTTSATRQYDSSGFEYISLPGSGNDIGASKLIIGNSTPQGTANNKQGSLELFGTTSYRHIIKGDASATRTITLPDKTGTIALTDDIPTITLNGSSTTSPSFYAPTGVGTSGYVLTSNGSGAPSWSNSTATPTASTIAKFDTNAKMNSTDMTSAEVSSFVESLNAATLNAVDYIIEQGSSDNWNYTKWNSGKLEQWYCGNPGAYTCGTARGNWYSGGDLYFTYPIPFIATPTINGSVSLGTSAYVVLFQFNGFNNNGCQGRIVAGSSISSNSNYWIFIHAVGKWK